MKLITDSNEQLPLVFPVVQGVEYVRQKLSVGDYGAWHGETQDRTVVERKSIPDLFTSFTSRYEAERTKILRAEVLGLTYVLAIEASMSDILKGHAYWKAGIQYESKKTGYAMLKQLMTLQRKYGLFCWFCQDRREMAIMIQEYFLAWERVK